jgi:hypothetical protein
MFQLIEQTVDETVLQLDQAGFLLSVDRCLSALGEYKAKWQILMLYEHYFPMEFYSSTASVTSHGYTDLHDDVHESELANEREREFFHLVNEHFFPLVYTVLEESWDDYIYRPHSIPVEALGLDWWNLDLDDLHWGVKIALFLLGEELFVGNDRSFVRVVEKYLEDFPGITMPRHGETNRALFANLCSKAKGHYATVPLLLDYLCQRTGNDLLDNTPEGDTNNVEWSFEWIDYLRETFLEAKEKDKQIWELVNWLDEQPKRWKKIFQCWNSATKITLETEEYADIVETQADEDD